MNTVTLEPVPELSVLDLRAGTWAEVLHELGGRAERVGYAGPGLTAAGSAERAPAAPDAATARDRVREMTPC